MQTWPKTIHTMLNDRRPCTVDIVSSPIDLSHICLKFLRTENASNMFTAVPENANKSLTAIHYFAVRPFGAYI